MKLRVSSLIALVFMLLSAAWAQNEGAISGTVQDSTGAVVPNATVKLTNHEQGTVRTAQTNASGVYQFSFLPAGTYDLEVSAAGFKTTTRTNETLAVAQNVRLDVTLEIGNVSENVTVSANTETVNTESAEVGTVVDNTHVVEMPLNGRQMWSLAELTPNVMPPVAGSSLSFRGGFNVAGNGETTNNFTLNGFDNNDPDVFAPNFRPSIDAIEEFNILTGVYSAQYGYGSGGQVIVTTKSGTNNYHGDAFDFLRNQVLDARNFFLTGPTPGFKQNQFGGTFGGPIIKDKTFFFYSYEGLRQSADTSLVNTVPTVAEETGDFSAIPVTIKDPTTGNPFAGNVIPSNRISPIGAALMHFLPPPTSPTAAGLAPSNNFAFSEARIENMNEDSLKVDQNFSAKDSGYATANYFNDPSFEPANTLCSPKNLPLFGCNVNQRSQVYGLAETHIFSPSIVNQARIGISMLVQPRTPQVVSDFWGQFGVVPVDVPLNLPVKGPPATTVTGYVNAAGGFGNYSSQRRADTIWIFNDNVSITHGRHTIKIGGNLSHFGTNNFSSSNFNGSLTFTNTSSGPTSGYALADMLLGYPATSANTPWQEKYYGRNSNISAYIQDDYKVSNRLTLNLGLRWEMNTPPVDAANRMTSFIPSTGQMGVQTNPGVGATQPLNVAFGIHVNKFDWHDYGPRIGIAWQPFNDNGKTVLRIGAGTFYNGLNINNGIGGVFKGYPYTISNTYTSSIAQPLLLSNPYPATGAVTSLSITGIDPNYRNPRVYEWSLGIQRQITSDMLAEVDYFGSSGSHLQLNQNINQPPPGPGTPAQVNARRPYPQWGTITWYAFDGNSHYQSLQAKLNKRYAYGLTFLTSFTYGKSIDDVAGEAGGSVESNQYDNMTGRGLSSFDVRYRFVISPVYELPFGKGKPYLSSGMASKIAGGWQLSVLFQAQTGTPLTATLSGNYSNTGDALARPNVTGNPNDGAPHTPAEWFNTSVFQIPIANGKPGALYQFGNEGRDVIQGPGVVTMDVSLVRTFQIREWLKLQFRAESFDFLNHPIFNLPNTTADSGSFGTITSTIPTPGTPNRQNQLAMKIIF